MRDLPLHRGRPRFDQPGVSQCLPAPDLPQQPGQHGPTAVCAGGMLFQHGFAARCPELIELRIGALVVRGDPRIADQAANGGSLSG